MDNTPLKRRKLLENITKSTFVASSAKWASPVIFAVALPVHAQASPTTSNAPGGSTTTPPEEPTTTTSGPVCADNASGSANLPRTRTDFTGEPLSLPQYDPIDGSIRSAVLSWTLSMESEFFLENLNATAATYRANLESGKITINGPDGSEVGSVEIDESMTGTLAPNESTEFTVGNSGSGSVDLIAAGIDPALLTGSGNFTITIDASAFSGINTSGNIDTLIETFAFGEVSIEYACEL